MYKGATFNCFFQNSSPYTLAKKNGEMPGSPHLSKCSHCPRDSQLSASIPSPSVVSRAPLGPEGRDEQPAHEGTAKAEGWG